jgi:L-fucose isomerase-like protein
MIAFLPIARTTFDIPFAEEKTTAAHAALLAAGLPISPLEGLITDMDMARAAAETLRSQHPQVAVIFQATFADSTMVVEIADILGDLPLLLWAVPEPHTGGRLRLNSFCGVNLAAFALKRRDAHYDYLYAAPDSPDAVAKIRTLAQASKALHLLRGARVGVVGEHPAGFEPCAYDAGRLAEQFGVSVQHYPLEAFFSKADAIKAEGARVEKTYQVCRGKLSNLDTLDGDQVRGTLSFYEASSDVAAQDKLSALAVRCWPETFLQRDCAICAASSMLADAGLPTACEADVNGVVTGLLMQTLSETPVFGADLISADEGGQSVVFWHCGLAPLSMCDPAFEPRGALHSNRKKPLLMEFPLKPGRVTLARISQQASGDYILAIGGGEMLSAPLQFSGTNGLCKTDHPAMTVLDTVIANGLDHHFTIAYGDHQPALRVFAQLVGIAVVEL